MSRMPNAKIADVSVKPVEQLSDSLDPPSQTNLSTRGRVDSTRKQPLAWLSAILTMALLILTIVHSSQTPIKARMHFVYSSSSRNIFILSILSGLTGLFLAATMRVALENVKWMLVSRRGGVRLSRFLALQSGTGVVGLLELALGRHLPFINNTRAWSFLRLVTLLLVPALGILIMSNINTNPVFNELHGSIPTLGWGMTPFDVSLVNNVSLITDQLLQAELSKFLSEPSRSVDITPAAERLVPCSRRPGKPSTQNCRRTYFIPGGLELAAPPTANISSNAEVYLARNQQGCVLDFVEGPAKDEEWRYDVASECQSYGFPFAAFELCMWNAGPNILQVVVVECPTAVSSEAGCLKDDSWLRNPGWTTQLTSSFRRATVAYAKTNGSILSHEYTTEATPAPISSQEMLSAFRRAFSSFPSLASLTSLISDPQATALFPLYIQPAIVWASLKGVNALSSDPALSARAHDTIDCLLAIMLYYSQPAIFARAFSAKTNLSAEEQAFKERLPRPDTEVCEARMQFELIVDKTRLVIYATLCGTALVACLIVLMVVAVGYGVPERTAFPGWDERVMCRVSGEEEDEVLGADTAGVVVLAERLRVGLPSRDSEIDK